MAIFITKKFETREQMVETMTKFHEALVGSPAYVNSEIAICETGENEFTLVVGNDNKNNLELKD